MSEFLPVNSLEIALRKVLQDSHTPLWSFYTPLAATRLWAIAQSNPERDGSQPAAGEKPALLTFTWPDQKAVSVYSSPQRAEQAMRRWEIPLANWGVIHAPGYQLLNYASHLDDINLWINLGCEECQKALDPDMIEILLDRGEPEAEQPPETTRRTSFTPAGEPERYLAPLRKFLQTQPQVQAAWIVSETGGLPDEGLLYLVSLAMRDPEDDTLLEKVTTMAKALAPVEMEWKSSVLMGDKRSFRNLAKRHRPFYRAADF